MNTLARIAAFAAAVIACGLVASSATPIDAALPLLGALIVLLAAVADRYPAMVLLAVPVLIVGSVAISDDATRLLAYGGILLFAAIAAFAGMWQLGARVELWRGVSFAVIVTAALRSIPLTTDRLLPLSVLILGVATLVLALGVRASAPARAGIVPARRDGARSGRGLPHSDGDFVGVHVIPIAIAVGLITPLDPRRALLLPLLLAAIVSVIRTRHALAILGAIVLAIAAGRWAMLLTALAIGPVLLFQFFRARRGTPFIVAPLTASAVPVARGFVFAPAFAADLFTADVPLRIGAMLLSATAFFLRPALSVIYVTAAIVMVVPQAASRWRILFTLPSAVFVALWIVAFSWSGALAAFFPLPVWSLKQSEKFEQIIGVALAPGESVIVNPDRRVSPLTLVASGSNISGLRSGTPVGRIEFVDESGRGFRRDLTIGDVSDWGAFRREHLFSARNPVPVIAEEPVERYGSDAFIPAFSRVTFAPGRPITTVRVTASASLPDAARLELHRFELPR